MNTWLQDAELGETLAMLPWVRGGITDVQPDPFIPLERVFLFSDQDLDLAKRVANLGWFTDGVAQLELDALTYLKRIAALDLGLARNAVSLGWFVEGVARNESDALYYLERIASLDLDLATNVANLGWFTDGVARTESDALYHLERIASLDLDLAIRVAGATSLWSPRLVADSLGTLAHFRGQSPQQFDVLAAKPWFADGLSRQDAAFLATLRATEERWPDLYDELIEAHYVESGTVDAPLAGEVTIWVIGNKPIDPPGYLLRHFAQAVSTSESLTGEPYPKKDLIVLYADGHSLEANYNHGSHITVNRYDDSYQVSPHTIFHEAAHDYMYLGNTWLVEGGANFIATMGLAHLGVRDLDEWPAYVARGVREGCMLAPGFRVIQDIIDYDKDAGTYQTCNYSFGEHFLLSLGAVIGRDVIGTALGEIYAAGRSLSEEEVYEIFWNSAPPDRRESVQNVYRELHGGPFITGFEDAGTELPVPDALGSELRRLASWFDSPPDKVHAAALAAIVKTWALDANLGLSLAQAAWVVDGVDHGEATALNALSGIAAVDPQLAGLIFNYSWIADGVLFWERKALEAVSRLAVHSLDDAERAVRYPWVADGATNEERLLLDFLADCSSLPDAPAGQCLALEWMEDGLTDQESYLLSSLQGLLAQDGAFFLEALALPWVVGGPSTVHHLEATAVRGLTWLVEADGRLANDVIRLEWVADGVMAFDESSALELVGIIVQEDVREATRIVNSPWFRDGIDLDDVLRLQDYFSD